MFSKPKTALTEIAIVNVRGGLVAPSDGGFKPKYSEKVKQKQHGQFLQVRDSHACMCPLLLSDPLARRSSCALMRDPVGFGRGTPRVL